MPPPNVDGQPSTAFGAESLLVQLAFPRENGSAALDSAQALLATELDHAAVAARRLEFRCQPLRADLASGTLLLAAVCLAVAGRRRSRRWIAGATLAFVATLAAAAGWMDDVLPRQNSHVLVADIEPRTPARRTILLTAHTDTKTEPLDHVGRGILFMAMGTSAIVAIGMGLGRRRPMHAVCWTAAVLAAASAAQLGIGRGFGERSRGAVDDGGACVLLVDLAAALERSPLQHTRITCAWFTGEEVGAQGSAATARLLARDSVVACVNLEAIGAGADLVVARIEMERLRPYRAAVATWRRLDAASDGELRTLSVPLWSDAGPLLAAGLPAVTLLNMPSGATSIRGLHGPGDRPERFDARGYVHAREVLRRCIEAADAP